MEGVLLQPLQLNRSAEKSQVILILICRVLPSGWNNFQLSYSTGFYICFCAYLLINLLWTELLEYFIKLSLDTMELDWRTWLFGLPVESSNLGNLVVRVYLSFLCLHIMEKWKTIYFFLCTTFYFRKVYHHLPQGWNSSTQNYSKCLRLYSFFM